MPENRPNAEPRGETGAGRPEPEVLLPIYKELCAAHHGIADFRAKLLALLPIASGTGLFLLLSDTPGGGKSNSGYVAIGLVGALLIFGLYLYELRGIQNCKSLRRRCRKAEKLLLPHHPAIAAFSADIAKVYSVGNTAAALVIYPVMFAAWTFLAVSQIVDRADLAAAISVLLGLGASLFGRSFIRAADKSCENPKD